MKQTVVGVAGKKRNEEEASIIKFFQ